MEAAARGCRCDEEDAAVGQQAGYDDEQDGYPDGGDRSSGWIWAVVVVALVGAGVVLWFTLGPGGRSDAEPTATPTTSSPAPTVTESVTATETTTPTESPSLEGFGTDPVTENDFPELGDNIGYGTAVRVGHHDGYDRVTFEFSGSGTPSFQVLYTDDPKSQGSGDPVQVAGDAVLQVTVTSVSVPDGSAPSPTTPGTDGTVFAQVDGIWGGFEGYGETFLGIDGGERPFKVQVLQDPMRLVVDVANG
jgi:hypothetical protein